MERKHAPNRSSSPKASPSTTLKLRPDAAKDDGPDPLELDPLEPNNRTEHWLGGKPIAPPDSASCKRYMQERLAAVLPLIANGLINEALNGDLPALKLILQMAELEDKEPEPVGPPHRCKSLEEMLIEDWQKEPFDESKP